MTMKDEPVGFQLVGSAEYLPVKAMRVLGIDLGTTNSTVAEATWVPGQSVPPRARCVEIDQETLEGVYTNILVPSVVAFHQGRIWIGEGAKRIRARAAEFGLQRGRTLFYECKNDIGLRRTYPAESEGFRSAADIGGRILSFLAEGAQRPGADRYDRIVVTVPASFQMAQREDTRAAARKAGFDVRGGDLLDEPVAAFLDYVVTNGPAALGNLATPKTLIVFDFGGGTCDVAILKLGVGLGPAEGLGLMPVAVSRYHRLGGGDLDAAIVHEVLIPQLCEQNNVDGRDLSFDDRKNFLEPALLGVAESLKVGLCTEIRRMEGFGKYETADKTKVVKKHPGVSHYQLPSRVMRLQSPVLTAARFEDLLEPFLDRDLLYARETEYRLTLSIFAPIQDALDRAGIAPSSVDCCLLVGGSSLIPQVATAVKSYLSQATVLKYADLSSIQTAVARGAAYHAWSLALSGRPPFRMVAYDAVSIRTASGLVPLVRKEEYLPIPTDGGFRVDRSLVVPESTLIGPCRLRVELVAGVGDSEITLLQRMWEIPGPVSRGDPLELRYRFDANQVIDFELRLANVPCAEPFHQEIENPLTHVVNPQKTRLAADQIEEQLRSGNVPLHQVPEKLAELGELHVELNQREKALDCLRRALVAKAGPDAGILNKMGIIYGETGDVKRQEKCYEEAAAASTWRGPLFNLALARQRRRDFAGAAAALDRALVRDRSGPYLVLRADVAKALADDSLHTKLLAEALSAVGALGGREEWELGWLLRGAKMANRADIQEAIEKELRSRQRASKKMPSCDGQLPEITSAIAEFRP